MRDMNTTNVVKLDDYDFKILDALAEDGRLSKAALAEKVGLSSTPCRRRVERLERMGIISDYQANFNIKEVAGLDTFLVDVFLEDTAAAHEAFLKEVQERPEIVNAYSLIGDIDYRLYVVMPNIVEFHWFFRELLDLNIGIKRYACSIIAESIKDTQLDLAYFKDKISLEGC